MIDNRHYNFGFLDEGSKREIRRSILKAVAVPGYQVPFGSRELPIGRGWGTGGIQITLSIIGKEDVLKVIDQGSDDSVNAVNIKKLVKECTDVEITTDSEEASIIQSRHRIPETPMRNDQILVLQVPTPEPLPECGTAGVCDKTDARRDGIQSDVAVSVRGSDAVWRSQYQFGVSCDGGETLCDESKPDSQI